MKYNVMFGVVSLKLTLPANIAFIGSNSPTEKLPPGIAQDSGGLNTLQSELYL